MEFPWPNVGQLVDKICVIREFHGGKGYPATPPVHVRADFHLVGVGFRAVQSEVVVSIGESRAIFDIRTVGWSSSEAM